MPDVFVSYSRKDSDFVKKLVDAFKTENLDVWVDFEDIPFATDWWGEIVTGIDSSETAIFVLSPDSVQSQVCSLEVGHMLKTKKRIIPIVCRDDNLYKADANTFKVPNEIRRLNWIFFDKPDTFQQAYTTLRQTMTTDVEAVREHTKLLLLAREWENKGLSNSFLLRGDELREFEGMLKREDLSEIQREFLLVSQAQDHFNQLVQRFIWGFVGGLSGMAYYVLLSFSGSNFLADATPIALALAAGEVFGVFVGALAVLSYGLPKFASRIIPKSLQLLFRFSLSLFFGTACWVVYQWFFLHLGINFTLTNLLGGLGLALGYMVAMFVRIPAWMMYGLTAFATYIPILLLNGNSSFSPIQTGALSPLIYFRSNQEVWTIGLPMAMLMALGAARPGLTRWLVAQLRLIFIKPEVEAKPV